MEHKELHKRLAYLEFVNDQLMSEVSYVNDLLKAIGFTDGLDSVKQVAQELLKEGGVEKES